ncbi:MAG: hypothetical protein GX184_04070 [Clostridiaceae bacterium]|nr:hypothetical protein [Clostridiaceae bacterium]
MGVADAENMAMYKSYIQRRRVGQSSPEQVYESKSVIESSGNTEDKGDGKKSSLISDVDLSNIDEYFRQNDERDKSGSTFNVFGDGMVSPVNETDSETSISDLLKEDSSSSWYAGTNTYNTGRQLTSEGRPYLPPYRKLYGDKKRSTKNSRPIFAGFSTFRNPSGYSAQTETNGAELIAIKVIKQCLACFAILGLVVLLQQFSSMEGVLEFMRRHIVDSHIEPRTVFEGVESIVEACSKLVGGSP